MELKKDEEYALGFLPVNGEYEHSLIITEKALEKWRDLYNEISRKSTEMSVGMYYGGRADLLSELLLHFKLGKIDDKV